MTTAKSEPEFELQVRPPRAEAPRPESEPEPARSQPLPPRPAPEVARIASASVQDALSLPDVINLREVVRRILRGWWIIVLTVLGSVGVAFLYLDRAPVEYTATLIISSVDEGAASSVASPEAVGALSALLGGGTSQSESVSDFTRFRYLMVSRALARRLVERHDMLKVVFASEWNEIEQRWSPPGSLNADVRRWLGELFDVPWYTEPSVDRLAAYLESRLDVANLETTPMVTVAFNHRDGEFARRLLDTIYDETDQLLREQDRSNTEEAVTYLGEALTRASLVEHRLALQQLLLRNLAKLMLLDTDQPFAARMLEPPYVSPLPTSPKVNLVLIVAFVGGAILGLVMVFFVDALRGR